MSDTPERIYLQLYGDMDVDEVKNEPSDIVADVLASGDVSWCAEQIFSADIEYIRIDLYEQLQAENEQLKADQAGWGICPDCGCCSYVPAPAQEPQ